MYISWCPWGVAPAPTYAILDLPVLHAISSIWIWLISRRALWGFTVLCSDNSLYLKQCPKKAIGWQYHYEVKTKLHMEPVPQFHSTSKNLRFECHLPILMVGHVAITRVLLIISQIKIGACWLHIFEEHRKVLGSCFVVCKKLYVFFLFQNIAWMVLKTTKAMHNTRVGLWIMLHT